MFQNAALDVAVGLGVMYLVLSLFCTVVNEYIATKLKLRSRSLAAGIREILDDPTLLQAFYAHGLIAATTSAVVRATPLRPTTSVVPQVPASHPAYISSETFVLALTNVLARQGQGATAFAALETAVGALPHTRIRDVLDAGLVTAAGDFDKFRRTLAGWFDDSMDRLSGAYKRNLKWISIFVGCAVAVLVNADSVVVGTALWSDGTLRAEMVQVATSEAGPTLQNAEEKLSAAGDQLRPLPIGWTTAGPCQPGSGTRVTRSYASCPGPDNWFWFYLLKILGWFVTGLALSFGAPFWFDTLSQFIHIRGTGVKPERAAPAK